MALTNLDLQKIEKLINSGNLILKSQIESIRFDLNQFSQQNEADHKKIMHKIKQIIKTENEDILTLYQDDQKIRIRIKKLEAKTT